MNNDEILIIKVPMMLNGVSIKALRAAIIKQKEEGVVLLPNYCEVVVAPKDVEIVVETEGTNNESNT